MRYESGIREAFRVVSVSGSEFNCACPWCAGSKNVLYANGWSGYYICFQCGAKGHLDKLDIELPQVTTDDVRAKLKALTTKAPAQHYYPEGWLRQFDMAHPYWTEDRRLPQETVDQFRLGYDAFSDRVTLPLRDLQGRILGVTYRRLDDGRPKYLHPKGFPIGRHLYGAWLLTDERKVALVEGQVDAIRCWSERVPALAMMGARLTRDQVKVLQRLGVKTVVLMMDNDEAGRRGNISVYEALLGSGIRVQVGWYRPYWRVKDPDGLKGDRLRKMFHGGMGILDWIEASGYKVP